MAAGDDEKPERSATVSAFSLDEFEVTVGRFRRFVEQWDYLPPPPGAGAHPKIPNSGWRTRWNSKLPDSRTELEASIGWLTGSTWNHGDETKPINCVGWYLAFAFCAWDGGRLPTESEWEYAAAGGEQDREFPWGSLEPNLDLAVWGCTFGGNPGLCTKEDLAPVGSKPLGAGRWGHLDLGGSMTEWVLDAYGPYPATATSDYALAVDSPARVFRGGAWPLSPLTLRSAHREAGASVGEAFDWQGVRCARSE